MWTRKERAALYEFCDQFTNYAWYDLNLKELGSFG